jgi:hypothetical protein
MENSPEVVVVPRKIASADLIGPEDKLIYGAILGMEGGELTPRVVPEELGKAVDLDSTQVKSSIEWMEHTGFLTILVRHRDESYSVMLHSERKGAGTLKIEEGVYV